MALRIVVADDHALTLAGVVRTLEEADGMEVVGTVDRGIDVMSMVAEKQPDVALLDIRMPGMDGMACLKLLRRHHPHVKVVMLSSFTDPGHIEGALRAGASAYIVKSVNPVDLPSALRQVCDGTVYHAGAPADERDVSAAEIGLTERERTILGSLARGLSNKAISSELWVTEQTVKFHLNNVYRKLGVANRAAAVRYAYEHGLVEREVALA